MSDQDTDRFETQRILLDAHRFCDTVVTTTKSLFGFITNIIIDVPRDQFEWLWTEIGDKVGIRAYDCISADHEYTIGGDEDGYPQKHTTLLGLWRRHE